MISDRSPPTLSTARALGLAAVFLTCLAFHPASAQTLGGSCAGSPYSTDRISVVQNNIVVCNTSSVWQNLLGAPAADPNNSIALGASSLANLTSGTNNTALGYDTGPTLTTGSSNILIGSGANVPAASTSNFLNIGNLIYGNTSTDNLGINDSVLTYNLGFNGNAAQTIGQERTTTGTNGYGLTINAGGAKTGGTNLNGGDLILSSGQSTGNGGSHIQFKVSYGEGGSYTTTGDSSSILGMYLTGQGSIGNGTLHTLLGINTATPGAVVEVTGTDQNNIPQLLVDGSGGGNIHSSITNGVLFNPTLIGSTSSCCPSTLAALKVTGVAEGGSAQATALAVVAPSISGAGTPVSYAASFTGGNVGIGTTTPAGTLDVEGGTAAASTNGTNIVLTAQKGGSGNTSGGNIILNVGAASGTGTTASIQMNSAASGPAFVSTSDARIKTNITPLENGLAGIAALEGVTYTYRPPAEREVGKELNLPVGKLQMGVIAQNVEQVFPEAVETMGTTGIKSVNYNMLMAPMIEAVKTLKRQNDALMAAVGLLYVGLAALFIMHMRGGCAKINVMRLDGVSGAGTA